MSKKGYPKPNRPINSDIFIGQVIWRGGNYDIFISNCAKLWSWRNTNGQEKNRRYIEHGPEFLNARFWTVAKPLLDKALNDFADPSVSPNAKAS